MATTVNPILSRFGGRIKPANEIGPPARIAALPFFVNEASASEVSAHCSEGDMRAGIQRHDVEFVRTQAPLWRGESRARLVPLLNEGLRSALAAGKVDFFRLLCRFGAEPEAQLPALVHAALRGGLNDLASDLIGAAPDVSVLEGAFKARLSPNASPGDTRFREFLLGNEDVGPLASRWRREAAAN